MATNPLPESCNGTDDDCNGVVDDVPDLVCGTGPCRRVTAACFDGGVTACFPGPAGTEVCNGIDDDCNGTVDDGVAPLSCGVGACANTVFACMLDGGANMCVPAPPRVESCNNIDDNCNGMRDEQADGGALQQGCYGGDAGTRNVGRCRDGLQTCVSGTYGTCSGDLRPISETCNGIDDNCNGSTDDGLANLTCGVGACFRSVPACVSGTPQTCTPGTPTAEICGNGTDEACNGPADETCPVDAGSCDPLTMGTWYQHHTWNPVTGLPTPKNASQFLQVEMAATRITPSGPFPLTISHVRVLGQSGQTYTVRVYDDSFGVPGLQRTSQLFTSNGTYQVVALSTPVTLSTSQSVWVGLQGSADSMTVRGDGNTEATLNMIYGCDLYFPPTCLGSWAWNTFDSYGAPFTAVDDLIIAVAKCP